MFFGIIELRIYSFDFIYYFVSSNFQSFSNYML